MLERNVYLDGSLVVTKCTGVVTGEELINSANWMVTNFGETIQPGFSQFFDTAAVITHEVSEDEIHRIAQINMSHSEGRGKFTMAILAVKPYPRALARLHKLLSAASNIRVELFDDIDKAYRWLLDINPELGAKGMTRSLLEQDVTGVGSLEAEPGEGSR